MKLTITGVAIEASGIASVDFTLQDDDGLPLDIAGLFSEGAVDVRFVVARLGPDGYLPYTVRTQTVGTVSAIQGTYETAAPAAVTEVDVFNGAYRYTFTTVMNVTDPAATHAVAGFATRVFEGATHVSNAELHWVPDGGAVDRREVVTDDACNTCHGQLEAHGGSRRDVVLCQTCHGPGQIDPDTGNSIDFRVMIHKIHRGEDLPSVVAGQDYYFVAGRTNTTEASFADVVFPQRIQNCETCHTGPDADVWKTEPTRETCASCHDRIRFVVDGPAPSGWENHTGGTQLDDTNCSVCHPSGASGGYRPIARVHDAAYDLGLNAITPPHIVELADLAATNTGPGMAPELEFTVRVDGAPRDILTSPLASLRATVAGPTSDYASYWQATMQGSGADGTLVAVDASVGRFRYTFAAARSMPASATGSYTIALEGYCATVPPTATDLFPPCTNTTVSGARRHVANNPIVTVAVTDATPAPRRVVVESDRCDGCHDHLTFHGGIRSNPNYCVMCHNANNPNDERASRWETPATVIARSTHFKPMIHSIHSGDQLALGYVLGGQAPTTANPAGRPSDFSEVRFPNDRRRCTACHTAGDFDLGEVGGRLPSREEVLTCTEDPATGDTLAGRPDDNYCQDRVISEVRLIPPVTATCTSCHDEPATAAHAEVMTTSLGLESCATCHDPGSFFGIDVAHGLEP